MEKIKESKGQAEMPETGAALDEKQKNELDNLMESLDIPEVIEELEDIVEEEESETSEISEISETFDDDDEEEEELEEEEGEEEEEDELTILRAQVAEQQKILEAYLKDKKKEEAPKEEKIKVEIDPNSLISAEEAEEFLSNPHKVLKTLAERVYIKSREDTLKDIPQLVESGARRQTALTEARNKFWSENADLLEKAKSVPAVDRLIRMTANEIQADNPDWTVEQIFEETGKQVRNAISLTKKAQQIEEEVTRRKKRQNQPTKPRGKRKSPPKGNADQRSGLQKDLDSMLKGLD